MLDYSANFSIDRSQVPNCLSMFKSASSRAGVSVDAAEGAGTSHRDLIRRKEMECLFISQPSPIIFTQHPQTSNARWNSVLQKPKPTRHYPTSLPPPPWGGRDIVSYGNDRSRPTEFVDGSAKWSAITANDVGIDSFPCNLSYLFGWYRTLHTLLRTLVTSKHP